MLKDLKIGTRLGAAISLIVIILVTVIVIGSANLGHYAKASGWNTHTYQVLEQGQTILTSLINIETGQRGFLIAGKDEFLEPLNKGKQNFDIAFDTIKDLTSDNPKQQERLSKLKSNYELWIKNAVETSINKRRLIGDNYNRYGEIVAIVGSGKIGMDGMRAQLSEIDKAERDLLVTRSKDMESLSTFTQGCLILGGVIGTLMSIILGYLVTQSITKPTMKLLVVSKKMAVGDFNFNLDIESKDEVGTLAKSMGSVQAATQMMVADATTLSKAAVEGKLATRADASKHQGDFRRIQNS